MNGAGDSPAIFSLFFVVVGGIAWLLLALKALRTAIEARAIAQAKHVPANSGFVGLGIISGAAKSQAPIAAPISSAQCVLCDVRVYQYRRSGRSASWALLRRELYPSIHASFEVQDGSGFAFVLAEQADLVVDYDQWCTTGKVQSVADDDSGKRFCPEFTPAGVDYLAPMGLEWDRQSLSTGAWGGHASVVVEERRIGDAAPVVVFGQIARAGTIPDPIAATADKFQTAVWRGKGMSPFIISDEPIAVTASILTGRVRTTLLFSLIPLVAAAFGLYLWFSSR